ncbi:type I DNA topoisomerase [Chlamydia trachomatis]|uniref:DNA topoisomerase 1 n=1 Tax=Chlamydia trachomatis serovar L2 (strain ATCC VR-902B / DSM 19102 / 434/Bu) TaxID=471472 RepID=A0A0H3MCD9_CHLT2|nr:type I DNA topoisomerase [Chlamydia trachomatis]AEJ77219.1 DNA topoisomerase I [Chlamydia trachomatis L2c]AGJ64093.1 DNA topoisomerase I [Chlamydia trachomatis L2/434/Bu(i)]AGJ65033.1 DNA topoisomerase I [Chlamydia trachomatis L2/434/Bu(f)]AGR95004.1 DNA topoisomerase I/SWI domain fusion protein [Chlamydia trachomatis RC-L2(s)/46]AGR97807.1 DNA topoisomerase I/SWI domain fusion protein [Chlamydia trachomatis RC-J/953]
MKKSLIIVESPAKIKTLRKLLGEGFIFDSSLGHIVDLPAKGFGIDIENGFVPDYQILEGKEEVIRKICAEAKKCDVVYLAPDPDREGEAIAWHIANQLPKDTKIQRISFNAITKGAVTEALKHPREIDMALVNAQQARRFLDRIVGYKISPILGRKLQRWSGVSAGRVQSVALKLVVDREYAIERFVPVEFWNIRVHLKDPQTQKTFWAHLHSVNGKKWEKEIPEGKTSDEVILIDSKEKADEIVALLESATYVVDRVESKEKKRHAYPPFITSTLQQEASRHYRFSSSRTMNIAQTLYEGVDLDSQGAVGLITYMRTDSVRTDPEAVKQVRKYIEGHFGKEFVPSSPNVYATKKMAQDAHEAIRPTDVTITPESIRSKLTEDQYKLYSLIWKRFVASQMISAIYDTLAIRITTNKGIDLRATGSCLKFKGFLAVYEEKRDEEGDEEENIHLPKLNERDVLTKEELEAEQSHTKPLPRFTEASLVKELEKSGIGRPSTYATIMNKIQSREYTLKEGQRLRPTELGKVVCQFLETNFPRIMDIGFTAGMEDELELIADNKKPWKQLLQEFCELFLPFVVTAEKEAFIPRIVTEIDCPKCHKGKLVKIWAKNRYFFGCSEYPTCDYKTSEEELTFDKNEYAEDTPWDAPCALCGGEMKVRHGKFGSFLGCENYPKCHYIVNLFKKGEAGAEPEATVHCPAEGCTGHLVKRRSRFNKMFYSCSEYPACSVIGNSVDAVIEKYAGTPKTPYEKKPKAKKSIASTKGKAAKTVKKSSATTKKRATKAYTPSAALAAVIGADPVGRPEATKKLWEYIKEKGLQSPQNKKIIIPDSKLQGVIGADPIDMFALSKKLSAHLIKEE